MTPPAELTAPPVISSPETASPGASATPTARLWKVALWCAVVALTAALVSVPVRLQLQSVPVSALDIFPDLQVFAAVFYAWSALLVVAMFIPSDEMTARWERLAAVLLVGLVFRGFWSILAPIQHQAMLHLDETTQWLRASHIIRPGPYADWPAFSALTVALVNMTGLDPVTAAAVQTFALIMIIAVGVYEFLLIALRSSLHACLGSIMVLAGDQWLQLIYWPWTLGVPFMLALVGLLLRRGWWRSRSLVLVALVLFVALLATHVFAAVIVLCVAAGAEGLRILRRSSEPVVPGSVLLVFWTALLAWHLYWAAHAYGAMVQMGYLQIVTFSLARLFGDLLNVSSIQLREAFPAWANVTRVFWLCFLFAGPGVLWLWFLKRARRLEGTEAGLVAAYLGFVVVSIAIIVLATGGIPNLRRSFTYGAFLTVPLWFAWLPYVAARGRQLILAGMGVLFVIFSVPSFLGIGFNVPRVTFYGIEYEPGRWIRATYGTGEALEIFADVPVYWTVSFSVPDAVYTLPRSFLDFEHPQDPNVVWQALDELQRRFEEAPRSRTLGLLVYSTKTAVYTGGIYSISPHDTRWELVARRLAADNLEVYDDGVTRIYARTSDR